MTTQIGDRLLWRGTEHTIPDGGPLLEAWPEHKRPKFKPVDPEFWLWHYVDEEEKAPENKVSG